MSLLSLLAVTVVKPLNIGTTKLVTVDSSCIYFQSDAYSLIQNHLCSLPVCTIKNGLKDLCCGNHQNFGFYHGSQQALLCFFEGDDVLELEASNACALVDQPS